MFRLLLFLFVYERKRLVPIVSFGAKNIVRLRINQVVPITKNKPSSNKHTMQNLTSQTIRYVFNHAWNVKRHCNMKFDAFMLQIIHLIKKNCR